MMFSVPQFIDVEDKIAGPLTWRQLLWMIGMGAALLVMFNLFDTALFIIAAVPTVLLFVALAFYRPSGIPLPMYIFHAILYIFHPKIAVWERPVQVLPTQEKMDKDMEASTPTPVVDKHITEDRLKELGRILDKQRD